MPPSKPRHGRSQDAPLLVNDLAPQHGILPHGVEALRRLAVQLAADEPFRQLEVGQRLRLRQWAFALS